MMNHSVLNSPWKQNDQIMSSHTVLLVSIYITDLVPADALKEGLKLPRDSHSCYLLFPKYPLWAGYYYGVGDGTIKKDKRKWQWKYQALSFWLWQWRIRLQCWRPGFHPWVRKIPWKRTWQPTPVFLPGESPWTQEPGRLQPLGLQRVGHDWAAKHSTCIDSDLKSRCSWIWSEALHRSFLSH